ncbi:MAG: DUF1638 domain-containing protein [Spirochaetota bacterium]
MRIKAIACKVFTREVSKIVAESEHTIDVSYLRQGLHDTPDVLREQLQAEIDRIDAGEDMHTQVPSDGSDYEAIALVYGLCSNAIAGVSSSRYRLVVPRAHDCIAVLMGSRRRYKEYFDAHPGTYWYSPGWIDQTLMPGPERVARTRERYVKEYGEENADYLMEMEQEWLRKYNRCTYVAWKGLDREEYRQHAKDSAEYLGWKYDRVEADDGLMRRLLTGEWDPAEVLIVQPGATVAPSYDGDILSSSS